ncbi:MAG TPA: peptidoglycan-binding protein, partial [Solirubrobacteraceae bacterium]|nr:peptidoglycan-binding protein [Solirubrobacteraceae bacterium]
MPIRRYLPLVAVFLAAVPATASAQSGATATLETAGTHAFEGGLVALAGEPVHATARAANALPGSTLTLTFVQGGRTVRTVSQPVSGTGEVTSSLTRPAGLLTIRARVTPPASSSQSTGGSQVGTATPAASGPASSSATARVSVVVPESGIGSRGLRVRFLQRRLADLGFAIRHTGVHDTHTSNAVIAHRKVLGMARTGIASAAEYRAAAAGRGA